MSLFNLPMVLKPPSSVLTINTFLKQQKSKVLTSLRRVKQVLARLVQENSSLAP
jgi:hypothetical protein